MELISFSDFKEINYKQIHEYLRENVIGKLINYDLEEEREALYKTIVMHGKDPKYSKFIMEKNVGLDFVGNKVRPKDSVTYIAPGRRMLSSGKVLSCTLRGFQIEPDDTNDRKIFRESCYVVKYKKDK